MATTDTVLRLRLYVAGSAPNSARARENLAALCRGLAPERLDLEVVDVLREPMRALEDRVFVTPLLCKLAPPPEARVVGDLSDHAQVRRALGLEEVEP
ncbi:MAG: Circadian clock protein KaiB [bacterium ADurb.Bin429]|nr:MAG: Circadian clock protein KaiB [bacterium ADurb.Bin429]